MIRAGETRVNEVTGETVTFLETAAQTGGASTLVEVEVAPGGGVPSAHVHPKQTETFEIVAGRLSLRSDADTLVAQPGDVVHVLPGRVHRFWNATAYPVRFRCRVEPALEFERLVETMFALAADGKLNRRGLPSPLRLAAIANGHFADTRAPYVPAWLQKAGLAPGALVAKAFGIGSTYDPQPPRIPATA